jgi:hypothetical protein
MAMKRQLRILCAAMLLVASSRAMAEVTATEVWVRATVPKQTATGAFMKLRSTTDVALVSAASPVANIVELHQMVMSGNVMAMRAIDELPLPTGKTVELKPGGYHVMLMELVKPLNAGDKVPITLTIRGPGSKEVKLNVTAEVRAPGAEPARKP